MLPRAAIDGQSFDDWREALSQATKLARTLAALTETLDRRRGGAQQRIIVERVDVHAGGRAIVGSVTAAAGDHQELEQQSNATRAIGYEASIPLRSQDARWETVPVASDSRKNGGVECMVARREAARHSAIPMHCGMVIIPPQPSRADVSSPS